MSHAMAVRDRALESWTGNPVSTESDPGLSVIDADTDPIEIAAAALWEEECRHLARLAVAPEELEHGARVARLMCPGSGGLFVIDWAAPWQHIATFESPDWVQSSMLDACQKQLFDHLEKLRQEARADKIDDEIIWPNDLAYREARIFICRLPLTEIPEPRIGIAEDGEVNFLWKRQEDGLHIDLGFYGTGTYSYYATNNNGKELMEDDVEISSDLPTGLIEMLRG